MTRDEENRKIFLEEAEERLEEVEHALLQLETTPDSSELIGTIFRDFHTIKGSGGMYGFHEIAALTHEIETVFDKVRDGEFGVTSELINWSFLAKDHIRKLLYADVENAPDNVATTQQIVTAFQQIMQSQLEAGGSQLNAQPQKLHTYLIRFRPSLTAFEKGIDVTVLLSELETMGRCEVIAQSHEIPPLDSINPQHCYSTWEVLLTTSLDLDAVKGVFIFVEEECDLDFTTLKVPESEDQETLLDTLYDQFISQEPLHEDSLLEIWETHSEDTVVSEAKETEEQPSSSKPKASPSTSPELASIRVHSHKLDTLVNLVGELVTLQARLSQVASFRNDSELVSIVEEVGQYVADLRDHTLSIRMLPIGTTFSKFKRLVRDLSQELGKEVVLTTEGAETELDKTVIEKLNGPLVHIIRNSVDHGIESPEQRISKNKSRQGTVHLSAKHSGAFVLIQVQDDGSGLNAEAIRKKAIERGLIKPEDVLSEQDLFSLIFAPGFSTAQAVTNISGRGVGMDVVKKSIENLGGSIEVSSQHHQGTLLTLKMPLTLAIVDGLLVRVGDTSCVIPLSTVAECIELREESMNSGCGRSIVYIREKVVPYIHLRKLFNIEGESPAIRQIVVTEMEEDRVGFVVDEVIGEHQTVIKQLSRIYRDVEGISGATILGDGSIALILDVFKLMQTALYEEKRRLSA